jgi:hypothetical protein
MWVGKHERECVCGWGRCKREMDHLQNGARLDQWLCHLQGWFQPWHRLERVVPVSSPPHKATSLLAQRRLKSHNVVLAHRHLPHAFMIVCLTQSTEASLSHPLASKSGLPRLLTHKPQVMGLSHLLNFTLPPSQSRYIPAASLLRTRSQEEREDRQHPLGLEQRIQPATIPCISRTWTCTYHIILSMYRQTYLHPSTATLNGKTSCKTSSPFVSLGACCCESSP